MLAALFILLSPGFLVTLPPGRGGLWMSGKTSLAAVLVHAVLFAFAVYFFNAQKSGFWAKLQTRTDMLGSLRTGKKKYKMPPCCAGNITNDKQIQSCANTGWYKYDPSKDKSNKNIGKTVGRKERGYVDNLDNDYYGYPCGEKTKAERTVAMKEWHAIPIQDLRLDEETTRIAFQLNQ